MSAQSLFSSLSSVPSVAVILFFVLGVVLAAELWYLRPKRKLPPIPSYDKPPPQPAPKLQEFRPLSQRQIWIIGFLLVLLVIIPTAVFLWKQTQEAKRVTLVPSPSPLMVTPWPTFTPLPTPTFGPELTATPSAAPKELAKKPLFSPTPTAASTASPTAKPKVGALSPSPTGTPQVEKPKELPGAASTQKTILAVSGGILLILAGLVLGI